MAQVTPSAPATAPAASESQEKSEDIKDFRRCPICWEGCKGVGVSYSTQGNRRYYKCKKTLTDQPPCGHTWTAIVQLSVVRVESRDVNTTGR